MLTCMAYPIAPPDRNRREEGIEACMSKLGLGEPCPMTFRVLLVTDLPKQSRRG